MIDVTQYELAVLTALWKHGEATIRQITEEVYGNSSTVAYATVQKLLERLEHKGGVARRRKSPAHLFRAKVAREDLIVQGLENLAEKLCEGSLTPLLVNLVAKTKLSRQDRQMLRRLIDDAK